ncbi:MAG: DUF4411 family protein [Clostridiales bacterium]|nr:DUF4411 family protein [Clostridiales bacterium]
MAFDFTPKFWQQMKIYIENGSIIIFDMVKNEIEKGNDELSKWIKGISITDLIDHRDSKIIEKYSEILTYIQASKYYSSKALAEWSKSNIADPWLIAAASTYGYTIITFERPVSMDANNPSSHPKIPNICSEFKVKYNDLYYMMKQLSFKLG